MTAEPHPPQRSGPPRHGPLIALLVLALIIVGSVLALLYGVRILSHNVSIHEEQAAGGSRQVTIKTPAGSIDISRGVEVDPALLGLPVYPGARRVESDQNAAKVTLQLPGQEMVRVLAAQFQTPDSLSGVRGYYEDQLKGKITKTTIERFGRTVVFSLKGDSLEKLVALKSVHGGTEITLARVRHGVSEAN